MKNVLLLLAGCGTLAFAQAPPFDFKILDKLGRNAKESANISLDENTIRLGASLFGGDKDAKPLADALKAITGIVVRSFEFDRDEQYNPKDLEPVRAYFQSLNWSKIVHVKSGKESSEIYLNASSGKTGGVAILTAEPRQVVVVYIAGTISVEQLGALSGKMGIPEIDFSDNAKSKKSGSKRE